MNNKLEPLFIIGAGRSGTNMLRDVLTKLPNMITWPCDEINLVFRHGNRNLPHDEFDANHVNPKGKKYIINTFSQLIKSSGNDESIIVEKTCANSLRIPFLNELFPNAKYVFIYRNGYDVTASAVKRWSASVEIKYLSKKLRFVPKSDIPYYTVKFLKNRFYQLFSNEKKQRQWGPVYKGMSNDIKDLSVIEVAAKQWARSVEKAYFDLVELSPSMFIPICYEDFVRDPYSTLEKIKRWNSYNWTEIEMQNAIKNVRTSSINKGKEFFDRKAISIVSRIVEPVMQNIYCKIKDVK